MHYDTAVKNRAFVYQRRVFGNQYRLEKSLLLLIVCWFQEKHLRLWRPSLLRQVSAKNNKPKKSQIINFVNFLHLYTRKADWIKVQLLQTNLLSLLSKGFNACSSFTSSKCRFNPQIISYKERGG